MMKSLAIATAAVAFSGAALLGTPTPAQAAAPSAKNAEIVVAAAFGGQNHAQRHRKPSRVHASGVARGGVLVPYFLKKAKAQQTAINNWNAKVRRTYGSQYANWNRATAKTTSCNRAGTAVSCRVSAVPSTPYRRFGMLN